MISPRIYSSAPTPQCLLGKPLGCCALLLKSWNELLGWPVPDHMQLSAGGVL